MANLFDKPIDFEEALESTKVKRIVPTTLSSKDLEKIGGDLGQRARFSARTANAAYLAELDKVIDMVLAPQQLPDPGTALGIYTDGMGLAEARVHLKAAHKRMGYDPGKDKGTIKDLSSDQRLNLIIKTNTEMARGYGYWKQGQDETVLDLWPAQELFRAEDRNVPRNWARRWRAAGGKTYGRRMIALKDSPIWTKISRFGAPYPPFDFNSGMDVMDVDRDEAERLGVIKVGKAVKPADQGFNQDLQSTISLDGPFRAALLKSLGPGFGFIGDVLSALTNRGPTPGPAVEIARDGLKFDFHGLKIVIEYLPGDIREGTGEHGEKWESEMPTYYGRIEGHRAADGEAFDCFLFDNFDSPLVYIIDQVDPITGEYDEGKAMIGFPSKALAVQAYTAAFTDGLGPARIGGVSHMLAVDFAMWLRKGDTTAPVSTWLKEVQDHAYKAGGLSMSRHSAATGKIASRLTHGTGRAAAIINAAGDGVPCGGGWISPDKECNAGAGKAAKGKPKKPKKPKAKKSKLKPISAAKTMAQANAMMLKNPDQHQIDIFQDDVPTDLAIVKDIQMTMDHPEDGGFEWKTKDGKANGFSKYEDAYPKDKTAHSDAIAAEQKKLDLDNLKQEQEYAADIEQFDVNQQIEADAAAADAADSKMNILPEDQGKPEWEKVKPGMSIGFGKTVKIQGNSKELFTQGYDSENDTWVLSENEDGTGGEILAATGDIEAILTDPPQPDALLDPSDDAPAVGHSPYEFMGGELADAQQSAVTTATWGPGVPGFNQPTEAQFMDAKPGSGIVFAAVGGSLIGGKVLHYDESGTLDSAPSGSKESQMGEHGLVVEDQYGDQHFVTKVNVVQLAKQSDEGQIVKGAPKDIYEREVKIGDSVDVFMDPDGDNAKITGIATDGSIEVKKQNGKVSKVSQTDIQQHNTPLRPNQKTFDVDGEFLKAGDKVIGLDDGLEAEITEVNEDGTMTLKDDNGETHTGVPTTGVEKLISPAQQFGVPDEDVVPLAIPKKELPAGTTMDKDNQPLVEGNKIWVPYSDTYGTIDKVNEDGSMDITTTTGAAEKGVLPKSAKFEPSGPATGANGQTLLVGDQVTDTGKIDTSPNQVTGKIISIKENGKMLVDYGAKGGKVEVNPEEQTKTFFKPSKERLALAAEKEEEDAAIKAMSNDTPTKTQGKSAVLKPKGVKAGWTYKGENDPDGYPSTEGWKDSHSSKKWGANKIAWIKQLEAKGDLATLQDYSPINTAKPNTQQKAVAWAQALAVQKLQAGNTAEATANAKAPGGGALDFSSAKKLGGKLGSNEGGTYDLGGKKYYVKKPKSTAHAKSEVLAARLTDLAGGGVVKYHLAENGGEAAIATEWEEGNTPFGPDSPAHLQQAAQKDFATHAWLGNWDSIGTGNDNTVIDKNGELKLVDTGGALEYRAMGEPKGDLWNDNADEVHTMRDPSKNPFSAKIYGKMSNSQLIESAKKVTSLTDQQITDVVDAHGPGNLADKMGMKLRLKKRRDSIKAWQTELEGKEAQASADLTAILDTPTEAPAAPAPVSDGPKAKAIPGAFYPPPPSTTWTYFPATAKVNNLYETTVDVFNGKTDISVLEAIKTQSGPKANNQNNKITDYKNSLIQAVKDGTFVAGVGEPIPGGSMKKVETMVFEPSIPPTPTFQSSNIENVKANTKTMVDLQKMAKAKNWKGIANHPVTKSGKIEAWKSKITEAIATEKNTQKNLANIQNTTGGKLKSAKTGYYLMADSMNPKTPPPPPAPLAWHTPSSWEPINQSLAATHKQANTTSAEWKALQDYTGGSSGSINRSFWKFAPSTQAKNAAEAVRKTKVPIPKGTRLDRGINMSAEDHKKILAMKPGTVFVETAISSTSLKKDMWPGNTRWHFVVGAGSKGSFVKTMSGHPHEQEVLLPPMTRYMIKGSKMVNGKLVIDALIFND